MNICDAHIHLGQFKDIYTSPQEIVSFMRQVGVEHYAVMSTTTWTEDYEKVLGEMRELFSLAPNNALPILWLTPDMLLNGKLDFMLESDIRWRAVKVHGRHPWSLNGVNECAIIAEELHLPLILHTGDFLQCEPLNYKPIIENHADMTFVLAHCRPVEQAIEVMQACPNCWGDTAFTPLIDVHLLCNAGLEDRLLFGSDYPMHKVFYPHDDMKSLYTQSVCGLQSILPPLQWKKISKDNFDRLYNV